MQKIIKETVNMDPSSPNSSIVLNLQTIGNIFSHAFYVAITVCLYGTLFLDPERLVAFGHLKRPFRSLVIALKHLDPPFGP